MNFGDTKTSTKQSGFKKKFPQSSGDEFLYKYAINFYNEPPMGKISLDEAEEYVAERLEILQVLDSLRNGMSDAMRREKNFFELLDERLKKAPSKFGKNFYELSKSNTKEAIESRKRDHVSHFLLRLYYCTKDELKKWFITNECELFRMRLMSEAQNAKQLKDILTHNGCNYEEVGREEKNTMITIEERSKTNMKLYDLIDWKSEIKQKVENAVVYCIPFEEALDLVKSRRVFLKDGFAYIMASEIVSIVCHRFRMDLSQSLAIMSHALPQLQENERLVPRLSAMHDHYIQQRKSVIKSEDSGRESITPDMIDSLAKESFPPCMKNMHDSLRKEHHLRHYGRLYYGLFLKSIGLNLDDALEFFRDEFLQRSEMTPERYQREYAYNIRYNYGKEGKKLNISGYSCAKIINSNPPGPSDTHGCPFKHFDANNLKAFLRRNAIDETGTQDILESAVEEKSCAIACSKFFSYKHPWYPKLEQNVYHPNQYYKESRKALKMSILTPPGTQEEDNQCVNDTSMADITQDESLFVNSEDDADLSMACDKYYSAEVTFIGGENGETDVINDEQQVVRVSERMGEEVESGRDEEGKESGTNGNVDIDVGEKTIGEETEEKTETEKVKFDEPNGNVDEKMVIQEKEINEKDKQQDQVEMDI